MADRRRFEAAPAEQAGELLPTDVRGGQLRLQVGNGGATVKPKGEDSKPADQLGVLWPREVDEEVVDALARTVLDAPCEGRDFLGDGLFDLEC